MAESEAGERPPCCSQSRAAASCSRPGYSSPRSSALNLQQVRRVRELQGSSIVQLKDGRWLKTTDRRMNGGGFVSVQVDITEIKRSEEVFRHAMEQAEAATRSKSEFLARSEEHTSELQSLMRISYAVFC